MRANPAQILFFTQYYKPELIGSGPYCAELAEWLAKMGSSVTVVAGVPQYPRPDAFARARGDNTRREFLNGIVVERIHGLSTRRSSALSRMVSEASFFVGGLWALTTRRVPRSAVVLSLCPSILSIALGVAAKRRGGRHVSIVHDIQSGLAAGLGLVSDSRLIGIMRWCERAVLNRCDLVIAPTREIRDQLRSLGVVAPIEVFPIWVDTDRIVPTKAPSGRKIKVLYSGNFGKKQGLDQVIEMADQLARRGENIEVVLRGSGSQADALHLKISERSLRNVRLDGLIPAEHLAAGLAEGDIHIVPQDPKAAAFAVPSKIFNIMAAGRPAVVTAKPGSPLAQLQHESHAFLCVPPNDATAFADDRFHRSSPSGRVIARSTCPRA